VFRKKSHTLYSCSDDRSVRVWSLDEMGYVETLFGHQDVVSFYWSLIINLFVLLKAGT
jgi:ribosomal RNA-processing protein 9